MYKISTALTILFITVAAITVYAEDPLKGGDLSRHLSGPKVEKGSLEGKVVLFEYWGYN